MAGLDDPPVQSTRSWHFGSSSRQDNPDRLLRRKCCTDVMDVRKRSIAVINLAEGERREGMAKKYESVDGDPAGLENGDISITRDEIGVGQLYGGLRRKFRPDHVHVSSVAVDSSVNTFGNRKSGGEANSSCRI